MDPRNKPPTTAHPAATAPAVNTPQPGVDNGRGRRGSPGPDAITQDPTVIDPATADTITTHQAPVNAVPVIPRGPAADPDDAHGGERGNAEHKVPGRSPDHT